MNPELRLRPHNLLPDAADGYPVTVESLRFRGEDTLVLFRGDEGILWHHSARGSWPWKCGDRLEAALRVDSAVLFPV